MFHGAVRRCQKMMAASASAHLRALEAAQQLLGCRHLILSRAGKGCLYGLIPFFSREKRRKGSRLFVALRQEED